MTHLCTDPSCYSYGKYCRLHKNSGVKKGDEPQPAVAEPIEKRSKKGKKDDQEYTKIKREFLIANPRCQVEKCNHVSEDVHHKRGRVGKLLTDVRYFLAVCRKHHKIIEDNPLWAKENGYSESRLKKDAA